MERTNKRSAFWFDVQMWPFVLVCACLCLSLVPSTIWEIFSEFATFCDLFYDPIYERHNSKIYETKKIFANIARSIVQLLLLSFNPC